MSPYPVLFHFILKIAAGYTQHLGGLSLHIAGFFKGLPDHALLDGLKSLGKPFFP